MRVFPRPRPVRWIAVLAAAALVAASLSIAGVGGLRPAAAAERQQVLGDFEAGTDFWSPTQQGGATGNFTRTTEAARSGGASGRWEVNVPTGGLAAIGLDLAGLDATALRFSVRTSAANAIILRLRDSTGQTHQQRIAVTPSGTQWTDVTVPKFDGGTGYTYFGGAADGVWHGPLTRISLILTPSELVSPPAGVVLLDNVSVDLATPEFEVVPRVLGNVFTAGQSVGIGFATSAQSVSWQVFDHNGAEVKSGSGAVSDLNGDIELGSLPPGWYQAQLTVTRTDGTQFAAGTDLAVLPVDNPVKDLRRGVNTHYGASSSRQWSTDTIPLITRAGFGFARDEAFWAETETTKGTLQFTPKVLNYTSAFTTAGIDFLHTLDFGNPLYSQYDAPSTPEALAGFATYADAAVGQFGTDHTIYEVWNEWNWRRLTEPPYGTAASYVDLLKATSDRVRPAHPGVKLGGPALTVAPTTWPQWIDDFIAAGGLSYIDFFTIHPYVQATTPEATLTILSTVRQKLAAAGHADMPIIFTEQGWNTSTGANNVSESVQSADLVRAQLLSLAEGVARYNIYDFKDDGIDGSDPENRFGLIGHEYDARGAYRPKPAYVAQAMLSHRINGLPALGWSQLASGVYDVRFDAGGGQTLHALWSTGSPTTVSLASSGPVTFDDLYGAEQRLVPDSNGKVSVTATTEPVFVKGPIGSATLSAQYSLSVSQAFTGRPAQGVWTIDRTGSSTGFDGSITIGDQRTTATVASGKRAEIPVTMPAATRAGTRTWTATVDDAGGTVARLSSTGQAKATVQVTGSHALTADGKDVLRLRAQNNSTSDATVDQVRWSVGGASGTVLTGQSVPAGQSLQADVPVDVTAPTPWTATLRAPTGDDTATGSLRPTGTATDAPLAPITLDGKVDPVLRDLPAAELPKPVISDWGGAADLSGRLWWTRDAENLYLTAEITDNVAAQPATGADIWQGDSVQVGITAGAPGEASRTHELGAALTDAGQVQVWRWGPKDLGTDLAGVRAAVARDDSTKTTTYELAVPFASLPMVADDRLMAATVVVNDNDGAGRRGWASWGLGVAETKNPAKFNTLTMSGPALVGLSSDSATLTLPTDISGNVAVSGKFSDGITKDLTGSAAWSSSDTGVATVSPAGRVTGVAPGTATITATVGSKVSNVQVTVTAAKLLSITLTPFSPRVTSGKTLQFKATGHFSDRTTYDLTYQTTWSSLHPRVATVGTSGLATAVAPGATWIRAQLLGVTGTTPIVVTPRSLS